MQANKKVITLREKEKQDLILDGKSLEDDSSDFFSDQYESYIQDLKRKFTKNKIKLTERER